MAAARVVIVDDSPFSIAVIRNILEENGFEVVGDAGTLEEVKQVVAASRPDLVTMDMTLPGTDGLECTRAVHAIDPNVKVIVISSMMDEEILKEAKENHVSGYIQKPVDADELIAAIQRVTAYDELFKDLENEYFEVFKESLKDGLNRMTKTLLTYKSESELHEDFESRGIAVIVGIIGKFSGRLMIDLSKETAQALVAAMMKKEPSSTAEITAALAEYTNIVAGNACSILNRKNKAFGLRLAPPSIMHGDRMLISQATFKTMSATADTSYGEVLLNVGFKRGEDKWT
ncbi:response regulator [Saccharibacillus alkalitolerans]|uniref:Response regulator n=1 Tax=Saccharibacillus alkalitolerans TaxID=2705290 RepID=A0ABX0F853_9BACL|nr:response regulator [Saccharibacillus alkalitolerans]NGZ76174.1 response regulator [Saccharibacillus alkalitolerans]